MLTSCLVAVGGDGPGERGANGKSPGRSRVLGDIFVVRWESPLRRETEGGRRQILDRAREALPWSVMSIRSTIWIAHISPRLNQEEATRSGCQAFARVL